MDRNKDLPARLLFTETQHIDLHDVHFRVIEVTPTRVVLATNDDPIVKSWYEAEEIEKSLSRALKSVGIYRSRDDLSETKKAKMIIDMVQVYMARHIKDRPVDAHADGLPFEAEKSISDLV